jgi:5-methylcytosine-specific restriction enzyme A
LTKRGQFCAACASAQSNTEREQRPTAAQRGYGARWQRLRHAFLYGHPLCADPFSVHDGQPVLATDVDHIVRRRDGGSDEESNLQPLCHSCHSKKTMAENKGRGGSIAGASPHQTAGRTTFCRREIGAGGV